MLNLSNDERKFLLNLVTEEFIESLSEKTALYAQTVICKDESFDLSAFPEVCERCDFLEKIINKLKEN